MKVMLADDDPVFRRLAQRLLAKEHEVVMATDGQQAWRAFLEPEIPRIAILNWMMPGLDGLEVCRRIRGNPAMAATYVLLVTAKNRVQEIVAGLEAGADDYIVKPFHAAEFRARIQVGERVAQLEDSLSARIEELEGALRHVHLLQGLLPICSYCKRIRDDKNYWEQLDTYLMQHSQLEFSHGICPECYEKVCKPELRRVPERHPGR